MTKDFSKHQNIINQFRGRVSNSDFEDLFASSTKNLDKTERFLLKMELKRLAAPCTRLIDLRGHVDGECRAYEQDVRIHFLDDMAIKVFEESLAYYNGYTFGVYEAVTNTDNNFRVIYQREKISTPTSSTANIQKVYEKTQHPAKLTNFGPYFNRSEERMNFAIPIKVILSNKEVINATSSDLSINGCKLRINNENKLAVGQVITIKFIGLEEEFQFDEEHELQYEIVNSFVNNEVQLIGLSRVYLNASNKDAFKRFLKGYIQGNKRRYKINLDNSIAALQSRQLETFLLPKLIELPVFIQHSKNKCQPRYALTCHDNQSTYQYWQDEINRSTLGFLLNVERIERLKKNQRLGKSLLVFSFVHQSGGKCYFYTVDEIQLNQDKAFREKLLGFFASKPNFAITDLSLLEVDTQKAYSPITVSNTLTKRNEYLNAHPSEEVNHLLSTLTDIVVVEDITSKPLVDDYKSLDFDNIDVNKLRKFGHKRTTKMFSVDEVGINYKNQRQEVRFKYETPTVIEIEGVKWQGKSNDFSASGLKVELDKTTVLNKGDIVFISFPKLQKITSVFNLSQLPYEIVRINRKKTTVNLRVFVEQHQHIGRSFFKLLIDKNKNKLTPDEYALIVPGMAKSLRNIYSASFAIPSLIIKTSGSRYKVEDIASSVDTSNLLTTMKALSDNNDNFNLYPLMNNQQTQSYLSTQLKKMQANDPPIMNILYISIDSHLDTVEDAVLTKEISEFESDKVKQKFISNALKKGTFFAVQLKLARTAEPDIEYLNPELSYISSYAIHRGKQIEQDIWSVAGLIQFYDITHEVLLRHQLLK